MNNPSLCIDVSKSSSFANPFLALNQPISKPFSFSNDATGVATAIGSLELLESNTHQRPDVVLEATGNYSIPLVNSFHNAGYNVVVLNPLETSLQKRKSIRKVKTDPRDTYRIAKVYYMNEYDYYHPIPDEIMELRHLSRQLASLDNSFVEIKQKFLSTLDLIFPGYCKIFYNPCCKTSLKLLSYYPSPDQILSAEPSLLFSLLKASNKSDQWCFDKQDLLVSKAKESLTLQSAQGSLDVCVRTYIRIIDMFSSEISGIRTHMIDIAKGLPAYDLLLSIPGVGTVTALTILAEIGDVRNFKSSKQLIAYAGLDPSVHQSGNFKASRCKISKRGTPYLRKALYQATVSGIAKYSHGIANPNLYTYYKTKIDQGKPTKVAIIAACNKLLRIIFAMLTNGELYRS